MDWGLILTLMLRCLCSGPSVLCYGTASMPLAVSELRSFSFAYDNIFRKLFKSRNSAVIYECQYYCGFLPFHLLYDYTRYLFLVGLLNKGFINSYSVFAQQDYIDLCNLGYKYNLCLSDSHSCVKFKLWKYLESTLCWLLFLC